MAELFVRLIPTFFAPPFRLMTELIGGGGGAPAVVHVLFVPVGSDSLVTSDGDTFKVIE